uniref:Uncharacterized protein n=1 Tax=Octopus bimaculoides TaxID=37653 RepID=A0A0L8ICY2_OCTBM
MQSHQYIAVVSLLLAAFVAPGSCRWFYNTQLNCFTECMTCLMTGLDCQPHQPFPSGYEDCEFSCFMSPDVLNETLPAIQSSLHFCRDIHKRDLNDLGLCIREHIEKFYPDFYKKLPWLPLYETTT